jgi:hypothetical protein
MKLLRILTATLLLPVAWASSQTPDSAGYLVPYSVRARLVERLDSIQRFGAFNVSRYQRSYDSTVNSAGIAIDDLYGKIDCLQRQRLGTGPLTSKLDSLITLKDKSLGDITAKVETLKSAVNKGIYDLNLPPELREKASELMSVMNKLDITKPNVLEEYLNVSVLDLPQTNLPSVNLNNQLPDLPLIDVGGQVQQYQNTLGQLPTNVDDAVKLAEENVKNISAISDVQGELGKVSEVANMSEKLRDQEALKKELIQEAQKQVVDHFAGKQEHLNKAMQSISKYKSKFSKTASLNDLPKKAPNEMKGKPLIERIVPGLTFQLQKKNDDLLVDFNLYFGYRFTKRFTSGAGWNQRVGYNMDKNAWSPEEARIYGPRLFSEYKIGKGFSPRVELELMNTFVPPYLNNTKSDPGSREWVWGAFVGIKKDYTLYKKIKGAAMVMFRPFDPHRKSPYADVVNARFGFEIPMKKASIKQRSK